MSATYKPEGMQSCIPYLLLPAGTAPAFLEFTKAAFDAAELERHLRPDGSVMHASIRMDDTTLMLADATAETPALAARHYVYVADVDATYQTALSVGATSSMAPADQPYGDRTGGVVDPWGNTWWLGTHRPGHGNG